MTLEDKLLLITHKKLFTKNNFILLCRLLCRAYNNPLFIYDSKYEKSNFNSGDASLLKILSAKFKIVDEDNHSLRIFLSKDSIKHDINIKYHCVNNNLSYVSISYIDSGSIFYINLLCDGLLLISDPTFGYHIAETMDDVIDFIIGYEILKKAT